MRTLTKQVSDAIAKAKMKEKKVTDTPKRRRFNGLTLEERQTQRRQKIIDAGLELYGTLGFFNVKIKDICKQAQLTERYFYESFPNAETLFHTIFKEQASKLHQAILASFTGNEGDHISILNKGVLSFLKTIQDDQRMARILYVDSVLVPDPSHYSIFDVHVEASHVLHQIIHLVFLKNSGALSETAMLMVNGFTGYCTRICLTWVNHRFSESIENVAASIRLGAIPLIKALENPESEEFKLLILPNNAATTSAG